MTVDHDPSAAYDDVNVRSITVIGIVGAVLVFTSVAAVQVIYFKYRQSEYELKVLAVPTVAESEILAEQHKRLTVAGPGAVPEKGEKSIPIKEAMSQVLAEYKQGRATADKPAADAKRDEKPNANDGRPAAEKAAGDQLEGGKTGEE
jgi:hypothetical protein